ncbi:MAG: hypothetical protein LBB53_02560 [Prevotellaceae bacterium]|nr:hypothetical protein [Prevotellaceae bacterium]
MQKAYINHNHTKNQPEKAQKTRPKRAEPSPKKPTPKPTKNTRKIQRKGTKTHPKPKEKKEKKKPPAHLSKADLQRGCAKRGKGQKTGRKAR